MEYYVTLDDLMNDINKLKEVFIQAPKVIRVCPDIWIELGLLCDKDGKKCEESKIFGIPIALDLKLVNKYEIER